MIAIVGSREFKKLDLVEAMILILKNLFNDFSVISGGAKGVDSKAKEVCIKHGIKYVEYAPDFSKGYDVRKYHERNDKIIKESDMLIAFWNGVSKGTESVIIKALQAKKQIIVIMEL